MYDIELTVTDRATGRSITRKVSAGAGLVEDPLGFRIPVERLRVALSEALHIDEPAKV